MSTSLLYHNQNLKGVRITRTAFIAGTTVFYGVISQGYQRCSNCRSRKVTHSGGRERRIKLLPTGTRPNTLSLFIPRLVCKKCGTVRQVKLPFADRGKSYSRSLARYVFLLCSHLPLNMITKLCGLSWNTVKTIHKEGLKRKYKRVPLKKVRFIAIDEVCVGRPRKFLSIVMNLETGDILHVARGKGGNALKQFWNRLSHSKAKIQAVCTDMASGYMSAVKEHLPDADLVLDHFHLVKYMNDKLSEIRRMLYRKASEGGKRILKGTRWYLLTSRSNLKEGCMEALDEALKYNEPLYIAYYLKEELASLWSLKTREEASRHLNNWLVKAENSGVQILENTAQWLTQMKEYILNWFKWPLTSAKLEAFNGKIRRLLKNTCGLRDQEYMFLRIRDLVDAKF